MYQEFNGPWIGDNENGTYKNPILLSDYSDPDVIRVGKDFIWLPVHLLISRTSGFTFKGFNKLENN